MKILKFGGTSVGKPERMHSVKDLITRDDEQKIVVLSAVSGTTNSLVEIGQWLYEKNKQAALQKIEELYESYDKFVNELYSKDEFKSKGKEIIANHFGLIKGFIEQSFTDLEERILLAQGELISTQLFYNYLLQEGVNAAFLPALDFMKINQDDEPDLPFITSRIKSVIREIGDHPIYITQGYICRNTAEEIDNLKRGGSDYTASLIGAAIDASEVQIWTDIDGMHNNDPRIVEKTFPIAALSFDEAAELAYFGAKILHPFTVRPAKDKGIPVKLLNTMEPDAKGTTISDKTGNQVIKAIAAKDNITAIKIKSGRMLLAYGFLRKVFEIFEKYKTPIDMITTSEVAVSLTIDNDVNLKSIIKELESFGFVEVDHNQTIVCIVGQFVSERKGAAKRVIDALEDIPLRMISYGGSKNNISILTSTEHKNAALNALNEHLFAEELASVN